MLGVGLPEAVQLRVTLSLSSTVTLEGLVTIDGGTWLSTTAYCVKMQMKAISDIWCTFIVSSDLYYSFFLCSILVHRH